MARKAKYIYVIRRADGEGPFKIGCSGMAQNRLMMLAYWSPYPLMLLGQAPGGHTQERFIHAQLDDHRLHHEWFANAPAVSAFAEYVVKHGELPDEYRVAPTDLKLTVQTRKWLEMATLFEGGLSLQQIAAKYNTTIAYVHRACRRMRDVAPEQRLSFFRLAITHGCIEPERFAGGLAP